MLVECSQTIGMTTSIGESLQAAVCGKVYRDTMCRGLVRQPYAFRTIASHISKHTEKGMMLQMMIKIVLICSI